MDETPQNVKSYDLQRSYGTNWTKTNVSTMFEWLSVAAFNIRCLELGSDYNRGTIRKHTIIGLVLSTLSGTISVSQFGASDTRTATLVLNGIFALFSFTIAVFTGYLKIYQVQERLEQFIKLKQDWTAFATSIASELQLPIELRRDALFVIIKNKNAYLDLLKIDLELPDTIKRLASETLPHPENLSLDVSTLPRIIMDIGSQELKDLQTAGIRNKDRFTHVITPQNTPQLTPTNSITKATPTSTASVDAHVNSVTLEIKEG
jgi:hypothetical protein